MMGFRRCPIRLAALTVVAGAAAGGGCLRCLNAGLCVGKVLNE